MKSSKSGMIASTGSKSMWANTAAVVRLMGQLLLLLLLYLIKLMGIGVILIIIYNVHSFNLLVSAILEGTLQQNINRIWSSLLQFEHIFYKILFLFSHLHSIELLMPSFISIPTFIVFHSSKFRRALSLHMLNCFDRLAHQK